MKKDDLDDCLFFDVNNLQIAYQKNQNGGGMHFGQDYISVITERYSKKFKKCYEFCSGPAYIGFSLLRMDLIDSLVLSDLYEPASNSVMKTIELNKLNNVKFYLQSGVSDLPENEIDLVVANPPHFLGPVPWLRHIEDRIYIDQNWSIHEEFFLNIASKMSDDGVVLLQENALGSSPHDFEAMAAKGGLRLTDFFPINKVAGKDWIYYLEFKKGN